MRAVSFETIILEIDAGLATITLNRPDRGNAMNPTCAAELRQAALQVSHDPTVRAVLLRRVVGIGMSPVVRQRLCGVSLPRRIGAGVPCP